MKNITSREAIYPGRLLSAEMGTEVEATLAIHALTTQGHVRRSDAAMNLQSYILLVVISLGESDHDGRQHQAEKLSLFWCTSDTISKI